MRFDRLELKFLVRPAYVGPLEAYLKANYKPDKFAAAYTVGSTYYDDSTFSLYRAHKAHADNRYKLRLRAYDTGKGTRTKEVFFEIKAKCDKVTIKERVEARDFFRRVQGKFFPVVDVEYERVAFEQSGTRITLDREIRASLVRGMLRQQYAPIFPSEAVICEVKLDRGTLLPSDLAQYLGEPQKISKYVTAVERFFGEVTSLVGQK